MAFSILGIASSIMVIGLAVFFVALTITESLQIAQTSLFTFLVVIELVRLQVIRTRYGQSVFSNPWLIVAIVSTFALQLGVLYTPARSYFQVVSLGMQSWSLIGIGFVVFIGFVVTVDRVTQQYSITDPT